MSGKWNNPRIQKQEAKMETQNGKIKEVPIDSIKPAIFNPPTRINHNTLVELKASISRIGIVYPLIVTPEMDLVDGHRRLECAKMLGMQTVPVIVRTGNQRVLFSEVNVTAKKLTHADDLFVYLSGGIMTDRSKKYIEPLEKIGGRELLEKMAEARIGPANIAVVIPHILEYIERNEPNWKTGNNPYVLKVINWMIDHRQTFRVRAAIAIGLSPLVIVACVDNNCPLPVGVFGQKS